MNKIDKKLDFWLATSVFIGTIIGAGIFALPYAFSKSGFFPGLIWLVLLGLIMAVVSMAYGEIVLRTPKNMEMAGYAEYYLGKKGRIAITFSLVLGIYAALTAYVIGVGNFLEELFSSLGQTNLFWSFVFWAIASSILYLGIKTIGRLELAMGIGIIFSCLLIFFCAIDHIDISNLAYWNASKFLFPYGVILFALGGMTAIPTMRRILAGEPFQLKKAIISGQAVVIVLYILFVVAVLGVSGTSTSPQALIGLENFLGQFPLTVGIILGILAMGTSFLSLAHILIQFYKRDFGISKNWAWLLVVSVPFALLLLGLKSFVLVVSLGGGFLSGIQGIVLLLCWRKAKQKGARKPEYTLKIPAFLFYLIIIIFALGIIYQILI